MQTSPVTKPQTDMRLSLTAEECVQLLKFVEGDEQRFRDLFQFIASLPENRPPLAYNAILPHARSLDREAIQRVATQVEKEINENRAYKD